MAYLPGPLRSLSSVLSHQQPTGLWAVRLGRDLWQKS